jgi:protein involved in temperature-dependent protein secretion
MEAIMAAIQSGDYARAYEAIQRSAEARETSGVYGAMLLALAERFDEADAAARAVNAPVMGIVAQGERQRARRWRDPSANGSFAATGPTPLSPLYAAMAVAFAQGDQALADRTKADMKKHARPIAGKLTFLNGKERVFRDIADCDDAIGQMLETYCGKGLLYFPFATLRRIEILPKQHIFHHLMPLAKITDAQSTATAFVPLLYAGSSTSPEEDLRTGQSTYFEYLGNARRGRGQRDFDVDGALVGLQGIASIDFA